ncbi:MAG TPA: SgcJ/EcaC family oxidoreductase [Gemmatimonadales bacterium]|jgi:uncharacterized protein (TIGR02246 family)|nr:SgcJ/EcaC family oxidoreductase [Gemmatimonadales bacterium]
MSYRVAVGLVALALASPLPAFAQTGDVRGQIEKVSKAWEKAYNAGDAAGVAALYTKDAQLMAPGLETASGTKAIQALLANDMKGGVKNALTTNEVVGFGDYALETGKWVATSADGKHLDHGPYMTLYKKEGGGWKLYRDTWNSAMPAK